LIEIPSFNFKGIALLPTFLTILLLIPIKETPKFLYLKRQDKKATLESLKFYQGVSYLYFSIKRTVRQWKDNKLDLSEAISSKNLYIDIFGSLNH